MERPPKVLLPVADAARKVQFNFTLKYIECDLADKRVESHPVIQMFFTNQFVRDMETGGVVNIHLDEDHLKTKYNGSIIATLDRKHDTLPPMSGIGICSYALHRNDYSHSCYVNVGTSHVFTGQVLDEVGKRGYYDHNHELIMRTVVVSGLEPIKKGVIELRINSIELGHGIKFAATRGQSVLQAPIASIESNLTAYVQSCMDVETRIPDLLQHTDRMRAPMNLSEVGVEFSGGAFLPAASFAMIDAPKSNAEFWRNGYQVVMSRRNLTHADYHDFTDHEKLRTAALMICYTVQSFDYIGDAVELGTRFEKVFRRQHVGTDEFSKGVSLAFDCEDGANMMITGFKGLGQVNDFDPVQDAHLIEMRQMLIDDYFPIMTLSAVHGAKIGDQEGLGAHMYGIMLPKHYVESGLKKTITGRQLLERMEPAVAPIGDSMRPGLKKDRETRPVLILEGTGIYDPIGLPVGAPTKYQQYKYIAMNMPSLNIIKSEIPRIEYADSPFYYAQITALSGELIEQGINVGDFILGTANPKYNPADRRNAHEMWRGHLFTDLIRCADNFAVMPKPEIPESTMAIIREANAFSSPPRPLVIDRTKPMAGKDKHPLFDKFVNAVASFKRKQGNKAAGSVDKIFRPHQFNENFINKLIGEAAGAGQVWAAEYVVEHITNTVYNYRLKLFVH